MTFLRRGPDGQRRSTANAPRTDPQPVRNAAGLRGSPLAIGQVPILCLDRARLVADIPTGKVG